MDDLQHETRVFELLGYYENMRAQIPFNAVVIGTHASIT